MWASRRQLCARWPLVRHYTNALLREKGYVDGKWVGASSGKTLQVHNPSKGDVVASVPDMDEGDTEKAVAAAHKAFQSWQHTTARERAVMLRKWYDLMVKHQGELADLLTMEQGKPIAEAKGEIAYGASYVEWFAEEARRVYGEVVPSPSSSKEMIFIRRPVGVAAMITPWNFPNAMITRKAAAAMAAGCTCVVKPAEDTPLSALALAALAEQAGIPPGVFNVVTGSRLNSPRIGQHLCESPQVAAVSFTGSTNVGKILYKLCSSGVKRLSLELGGNAPFIVFDTADIALAVDGAMKAKFRNSGQTCVSINRIFVQRGVFQQFVQAFQEAMEAQLVLGDGFDTKANQGPLINQTQAKRVQELVQDAVSKGAKVLLGGKPVKETFYEPTLLTGITPKMNCYQEEIFGPVAVCNEFSTEEEALAMANDTNRGLAGYFYSNDVAQVWRVAKKLEVGMVGINEGMISAAEGAFGGMKESGIGREGSRHGIDEYTYVKYLCFGNLKM